MGSSAPPAWAPRRVSSRRVSFLSPTLRPVAFWPGAFWAVALLSLMLRAEAAGAQGVEPAAMRIGVLGLFRPQVLSLSSREPLTFHVEGDLALSPVVLDRNTPATVHAGPGGLTLRLGTREDGASGIRTLTLARPATFTLAVPGKLRRTFTGGLELRVQRGVLQAVVVMETERAVASVVAAESPPGAPLEALKAQAVAVRSFLLAGHHHAAGEGIDACDTTHCQFLREPPPPGSPAARATEATRGTVLIWSAPDPNTPGARAPGIVPALYTRSCDGETRPLRPARAGEYPFYAVLCAFCRRHPERWSRPAPEDPLPRTESERLDWNRTHGAATLPSNHFARTSSQVNGVGRGHGIGLCQLGAADLAREGASFRAILAHFYPDTSLRTLPGSRLGT